MRAFIPLAKTVENADGTLDVWGIASSPALDSQGEVVRPDAIKAALPDFFRYGTGALREMHQPSAAGTVDKADVEDDGNTYIKATVVDPLAIKKVRTGTYKGFSIGGKVTGRDPMDKSVITSVALAEISLVDRPANPEAVIEMWKADAVEKAAADADGGATGLGSLATDATSATGGPGKGGVSTAEGTGESEIDPEEVDAAGGVRDVTAEDVDNAHTQPRLRDVDSEVEATNRLIKPPGSNPGPKDNGSKADGAGDLGKGMWTVSSLAELVGRLNDIRQSTIWEAEAEGDNSPIPAALRAAVDNLAGVLRDMVAEETAELTADAAAGVPMLEAAADVYSASEPAGDLEKAGARNSKADMAMIQSMHDTCCKLGAACMTKDDDGDDDMSMAAQTADLGKIAAERDEALGKVATLEADLAKANAEIEQLKKQPEAPKAHVRVIEKGDDATRIAKAGPSPEQLARMSPAERAHELTKAALANPLPVMVLGAPLSS